MTDLSWHEITPWHLADASLPDRLVLLPRSAHEQREFAERAPADPGVYQVFVEGTAGVPVVDGRRLAARRLAEIITVAVTYADPPAAEFSLVACEPARYGEPDRAYLDELCRELPPGLGPASALTRAA